MEFADPSDGLNQIDELVSNTYPKLVANPRDHRLTTDLADFRSIANSTESRLIDNPVNLRLNADASDFRSNSDPGDPRLNIDLSDPRLPNDPADLRLIADPRINSNPADLRLTSYPDHSRLINDPTDLRVTTDTHSSTPTTHLTYPRLNAAQSDFRSTLRSADHRLIAGLDVPTPRLISHPSDPRSNSGQAVSRLTSDQADSILVRESADTRLTSNSADSRLTTDSADTRLTSDEVDLRLLAVQVDPKFTGDPHPRLTTDPADMESDQILSKTQEYIITCNDYLIILWQKLYSLILTIKKFLKFLIILLVRKPCFLRMMRRLY